jgi:hypothetical protein
MILTDFCDANPVGTLLENQGAALQRCTRDLLESSIRSRTLLGTGYDTS